MPGSADFLVEIGTEELPPKSLRDLVLAFASGFTRELEAHRLGFSGVSPYASPRRLALIVRDLAGAQEDRHIERKGPPVNVAFDNDGEPTPAAHAFAKKCGADVSDLGRSKTDKGEWLSYTATEKGLATADLLPAMIETALAGLPVPRPMRWGSSDTEFVRPVHWLVMLHGKTPVEGRVLGIEAGVHTRGHRFLAPAPLRIPDAAGYPGLLENEAFVIADFAERRARIEQSVAKSAAECGGQAVGGDALYDEVTALVEWPVAITGRFDDAFLALPAEVIVATLSNHQRYFPVKADDGMLLPFFITIANLVSKDPDRVREGNERVIRPRLADAAFFWDSDRSVTLEDRRPVLEKVVYQKGLGSTSDKSDRIAALAGRIAVGIGGDPVPATRAARLAKCDLMSGMVGEFPELQGTMGRYYALADGEPTAVADAIGEQYLPRFAGDAIPSSVAGKCVALGDKLDSLCGIFSLGRKPSGNRDPFGLRRAALGIVRIIVEGRLDIDLVSLIGESVAAQPVAAEGDVCTEVYAYIVERMRGYYLEREGMDVETFAAVRDREPHSLLDFDARIRAVAAFTRLPSAAGLAAANKRIANILRQAEHAGENTVDATLLAEDAEEALYLALQDTRRAVLPLLEERAYTDVLTRLADLREPVDDFFDKLMVMVDDEAVRLNRLALLAEVREQFLDVADVSRLSVK